MNRTIVVPVYFLVTLVYVLDANYLFSAPFASFWLSTRLFRVLTVLMKSLPWALRHGPLCLFALRVWRRFIPWLNGSCKGPARVAPYYLAGSLYIKRSKTSSRSIVFNSDFDLVAPRQNSKLLIRRQLSQAICGFETTSITHFEIGRENFNDNTFKTYWSAQLQLEGFVSLKSRTV